MRDAVFGGAKAKVLQAVVLGPCAGAAVTAAITVVIAFIHSAVANTLESNAIGFALSGFFALVAAGAVAAFLVSVTVGLCWHSFSQAHGWTSARNYWLTGALVGLAVPLYLTIILWGATWTSGSETFGPFLALTICPYGAMLGGLTGLFAWRIRRPDRSG